MNERAAPITLPGFNRLTQTLNGPMLYNPRDEYIGRSIEKYGEFSRGETLLFQQIIPEGARIIEGGSNIGYHTVQLSRLAGPSGKVFAFEPQRIIFQTLCGNLALNGCGNVIAGQIALGAEAGSLPVPWLPPDECHNFGGLSLGYGVGEETTQVCTIDDMFITLVHFLKLDVEGMEVEALKGAARTIRRCRPLMYVENDRAARSEELTGLLLGWDYRLYWHLPPLFSPDNFAGDAENVFGNIASFNMLCVPKEQDVTVTEMREITSPELTLA